MAELDLADEAIRRLAPDRGTLAVVEWIATHGVKGCFVTTVTDAGGISSHWLAAPPVDVYSVAKRMSNRLKNWYLGRPGDPFDLPAWQELERWLVDQLTEHLHIGDHVVFLEHKDFAGLPWHVAASTRWTSSYATGWSVLLSLGEPERLPDKQLTIGVVMVPRFGESSEVSEALEASSQHAEDLAASEQLPFVSATNHSSDSDHFREVLEHAHVAKVLCHGFVDAEGEVALMLAHGGSLPLADSVAAGSEVGRRYRMSWRTLQSFSAAPTTVFSAACSSGIARSAGLGERLGLFNALRQSGTRSMVAPWWDIVASSVLPVLDDAFERHVRSGKPLARALHEACTAAENDRPRWLAWALALEGGWR